MCRYCCTYLVCVQVRKERDLLQARVEAAEAELERERGLHRRELRRRGKETQEVRVGRHVGALCVLW